MMDSPVRQATRRGAIGPRGMCRSQERRTPTAHNPTALVPTPRHDKAGLMQDQRHTLQRTLTWAWLSWIAFIIYGSLIPFEFHAVPWSQARDSLMRMPWLSLGLGSRIDWLANVILYFPLGFLGMCVALAGDLRGRRNHRVPHWLQALALIGLGAALALAIEFAQIFFAPRTVSLNDLVAELGGVALGSTAGLAFGRWFVRLLSHATRSDTPQHAPVLQLYTLIYLALCLFPFDFSTAMAAFEQKLATGHAGWWMAPIHRAQPLRALVQLFGEAVAVLPFGIALGMGSRPMRWPAAAVVGLGLSLAIEVVQLFLLSATSQGASVLSRTIGFAAGAALVAHSGELRNILTVATLRRLVIAGTLPWLLVLAYLAGWGRGPVSAGGWWERAASLHYLPFYYHYYVGEARALTSVLQCVASYAWVGIAVGLYWPRPRPMLAAGLAALAAVVVEGSQLFLDGRRPDPTNVLIGAAAAWAAHAVLQRLHWRAPVAPSGTPPMAPPAASAPSATVARTPANGKTQACAGLAAAVILGATYATAGNTLGTAFALATYVACVWLQPQTALFLVPIVIGLTDITAYTGPRWLDTLDLVMLATGVLAFVHPSARTRDAHGRKRRLPAATWWLLGLVPGTVIGWSAWAASDPNALLSPLGSAWGVMQSKGLLWAFVLALFVQRLDVEADDGGRMLGRGMVVSLAGVALLTIEERLAFVGPLDFSSDYRAPGPFSAISLGGAFIECFLVAATPFAVVAAMRETRSPVRWASALLVLISAYATMVTFSRAGQVVFLVAVGATVTLLASHRFGNARERWLPGAGKGLLLIGGVACVASVVLMAPYAGARFATLGEDAGTRVTHWRDGLALSSDGTTALLFGNGMGSFGRTSYLMDDPKTRPGAFTLMRDDGNTWLRVSQGSLSYLDQRIDVSYGERLEVTAKLRAARGGGIELLLCEKDLVQSRACGAARLVVPADGTWHTVSASITLPRNPAAGWPARPVRMTLFSGAGEVDVDDLSVVDPHGNQRLRNGGFEDGPAHWLYSSDRHLTWHMKNLWLQVLFEQGIVGVAAHAALLVAGVLGAWRAAARGQRYFLAVAIALLAFHGVGLTDSVIDSTRFLQLYLSLALIGAVYGARGLDARPARTPPSALSGALR